MRKLFVGLVLIAFATGCRSPVSHFDQQPKFDSTAGYIDQINPCRVKYHRSYETSRFMVVDGRLGNGSRSYPIILDTGASQHILIKAVHLLDSGAQIYPLTDEIMGLEGYSLGSCHLSKLRIGDTALVDWPCLYLKRQRMKFAVFGLPAGIDKSVIVGLPALRKFKYVMFDSIRKEVEFSNNKFFEPTEPQQWTQYPFVIEEDFHGNMFMFVQIPIAGEVTELQLDTGSGNGLAIREELWEKINQRIADVRLSRSKELYPYIGLLPCRKGVIQRFQVGDRLVDEAMISVFPDESPLLSECQGMLGMQFFRDTVMVLDFENKLMWVKGI